MTTQIDSSPISTGVAIDGSPHQAHFDAMLDVLERLQDAGPEYGGFLANHGPMAADASSRLGAAPPHVAFWVDLYRRTLEGAPPDRRRVDNTNWHQQFGHGPLLGDWIGFFDREISAVGWREAVARWWPRLLPGAAAGAAHGLIRTGHAIRTLAEAPEEHELFRHELAQGLGYWAARYQPVPGAPTLAGARDVRQALGALPRLAPSVPSAGQGIAGRFTSLVTLRDLPDALDEWHAGDLHESFDQLISAAARLVANRADAPIAFCHALTAPAAVHMVVDELPEELQRPSLAVSFQLVGAIVAGFGFPSQAQDFADVVDTEPESPSALADAAIAHGDDHVLKFTEAAVRQYRHTSDPVLLVAAERFRNRMPTPGLLP